MEQSRTTEDLLIAIVALLAESRADGTVDSDTKTEVLLSRCGLSNELIARIVGKKVGAVRMAITRATTAKTGVEKDEQKDG